MEIAESELKENLRKSELEISRISVQMEREITLNKNQNLSYSNTLELSVQKAVEAALQTANAKKEREKEMLTSQFDEQSVILHNKMREAESSFTSEKRNMIQEKESLESQVQQLLQERTQFSEDFDMI